MSKITTQTIEKVARLSRLSYTDEQAKLLTGQLRDIVTYMDKLNELDTENIEPTLNPNPTDNIFRDDKISRSLSPKQALSNAPESESNSFRTPKIIQE